MLLYLSRFKPPTGTNMQNQAQYKLERLYHFDNLNCIKVFLDKTSHPPSPILWIIFVTQIKPLLY
jgi:hypothetical protein